MIGRPKRFPRRTAAKLLPYREKSPKLSIGPEKYDTTMAIAESITGIDAQNDSGAPPERLKSMLPQPAVATR